MDLGRPKPTLSVTDAIAVVVGIVVGAGIFAFPSMVAGALPHPVAFMLAWLAGGVICVVGALCYAELATTYPDAGGEYHFLNRGLGAGPAFLFAWARLAVIQTGSIAIHAFIIGDYVASLIGVGDGTRGAMVSGTVSALTVAGLTFINIIGLRVGKTAQKVLVGCVMTAVLLVCLAGLTAPRAADTVAQTASATSWKEWPIGLAMVFVLLTYGGWNEAAYLSAEVRGGRRGIVKVLLGGIALVTAVYLLVNLAYLSALGVGGVAKSNALAADVLGARVGDWAAKFISVVIVVAAAGNMNATILTGARTSYALGRDFPMFAPLGRWRDGAEAPVTALIVQGIMTLALVAFGAMQRNGLSAMVDYTTPVFWLFFLLTGVSLIILRMKDPDAERPFRVPLYPVTPILFCLVCAYMLYSGLNLFRLGALVGVGVLLLGTPLMLIARQQQRSVAEPTEPRGFEPVIPATATQPEPAGGAEPG